MRPHHRAEQVAVGHQHHREHADRQQADDEPEGLAHYRDAAGTDWLYVANEGVLLAVVPAERAAVALQALRSHPLGAEAALKIDALAPKSREPGSDLAIGHGRILRLDLAPLPRIPYRG